MSGVGRLRAERVVVDELPPAHPVDLPLERRHVRRPVPQPHRVTGSVQQACPVRPDERRRRPDEVHARPVLRRELRRRRLDADDTQVHPDGFALRAEQQQRQGIPHLKMRRSLRDGEGDVHLVRLAGVRQASGEQLPVPERPGNRAVQRGAERRGRRLEHGIGGDRGQRGDLREPRDRRGRNVGVRRPGACPRPGGDADQVIGRLAPGDQRRVGRVGAAGAGGHRGDQAAGQPGQHREHEPGPPPCAQPGADDQRHDCHGSI